MNKEEPIELDLTDVATGEKIDVQPGESFTYTESGEDGQPVAVRTFVVSKTGQLFATDALPLRAAVKKEK